MTVLLRRSDQIPVDGWDFWIAIAASSSPATKRRLPDLGQILENAFDTVAPALLEQCRQLNQSPDAVYAHTPSCATNISDFGVMLAWDHVIQQWAERRQTLLVVCDDPWLFRHWRQSLAIDAGQAPPMAGRCLKLALRGWTARMLVSVRMAVASLRLRRQRRLVEAGAPALLVYGHPRSTADGDDAYFGPLLKTVPRLTRLLHVDCGTAQALALQGDGQTLSLHAFGSPWAALGLWRHRWRPRHQNWLVRRAAALEAGTGMPAMIAWQLHCQQQWLLAQRPQAVAWPWENHNWERAFVRQARNLGTRTIGYQHSRVGRREWNYSPVSNADGHASWPDLIMTVGTMDKHFLISMGYPPDRLEIGGALRFMQALPPHYDPDAPVLLALPFDAAISAEMIEAVRPLGRQGKRILVKDHPMSPVNFIPSERVERTTNIFGQHPALSAVIYCITTVGLEAYLAGLPTIRFIPASRPVVDILPEDAFAPSAMAETLSEAVQAAVPPPWISRDTVFAKPDFDLWQQRLTQ